VVLLRGVVGQTAGKPLLLEVLLFPIHVSRNVEEVGGLL
jgi:hypothetical protein